jgi:hypothetical protein
VLRPTLNLINTLLAWLISHQPAVPLSQNKSATSNQPALLFSQNKSVPSISHQPNEQAASSLGHYACGRGRGQTSTRSSSCRLVGANQVDAASACGYTYRYSSLIRRFQQHDPLLSLPDRCSQSVPCPCMMSITAYEIVCVVLAAEPRLEARGA